MSTTTLFLRILLPVALLSTAHAATLRGTVADPTGQPMPYARVTVFARDSQQRISTTATEDGRYQFDGIAPGNYLVQADAPGLDRTVAAPVTVTESATLDLELDLAQIRTEVIVTATGTAPVQTTLRAASATAIAAPTNGSR